MSAQDEANQAAKDFACNSAAQLALLANPDATELIIDGVLGPAVVPPYVSPPGTKIFYNSPQTCSVTCPDSSLFTFTCPPGRFIGANQVQANAKAMSYACQQAALRRVCPPAHPCVITDATPLPAFDQGQPYSHQITVTGGVAPLSFSIVSGTPPTGLSMDGNGLISGTAALVNGNLDASFTVRVTDSGNPVNSCFKSFLLPVLDYNNYPPGKKWRIKNYVPGYFTFSGPCFCAGPFNPGAPIWNGQFDSQNAPAVFRTAQGIEVNIGGLGASPFLNRTFYGLEWFVQIGCTNGDTIDSTIWWGKKIGSNFGSKLDSPAGIYTIQTGLLGEPTPCESNATIELEEY